MSSEIKSGQLRKWLENDELFLVLFPTPDERKEKYGIKHWLVSSRGRETYRREITIIENSMVVSDAT